MDYANFDILKNNSINKTNKKLPKVFSLSVVFIAFPTYLYFNNRKVTR